MHSNIDLEKAEITHSYSNESCHQSKEQDFSLFSDSDTLSHKKLMTYLFSISPFPYWILSYILWLASISELDCNPVWPDGAGAEQTKLLEAHDWIPFLLWLVLATISYSGHVIKLGVRAL